MNRYNKGMNKINVTPEMHKRIMENIQETHFEIEPRKVHFFQAYKRYIGIAACLMICVGGSLLIPHILKIKQEPPVQVIPSIVKYDLESELSSVVGFEIKEIRNIPFEVEQIEYISYGKELAESIYSGSSNVLSFRMAKENGDISGDYREYKDIKNATIGDYQVTLKGNNEEYNLAIWEAGGFSYAVRADRAISEIDWVNMIQSIQ